MSSIKIYKAFPAYQNYLDAFYFKNPKLKSASFDVQKNALIHDGFPWIFSWSTNNTDENIEIFETVHNCKWLQKAWSKSKLNNENWQTQTVLDQIKKIQPNICILYPPQLFNHNLVEEIRNIVAHEVFIVGYDGMNRMDEKLYQNCDLILTCHDNISSYYKQKNLQTYTLEFGFDEGILNKINVRNKPIYNVGFSGTIYHKSNELRYETLKYLTKKTKIDIRSEFYMNSNHRLLSKRMIKLLLNEKDLSEYFALWRIGKMNSGPVFGLNMYQFIKDSKISLNIHGNTIDFAANVRMYEITGVGSCMLAEWKKNISEIFIPDEEIVTYKSFDEAYDKIKFLTKNEQIRNKIALAGQKRTLNNYNYKNKISDLISFLKSRL